MQSMHKLLICCCLAACSKSGTDAPDSQDTGHTGDVVYPSHYEAGKYRATSVSLLPTGEGLDLTGDGEIDNVLPAKLPLINAFTSDDLSFEGMNTSLAESVANDTLIVLMEAAYAQGLLSYDVLLGATDATDGLTVDPVSLNSDGSPTARFQGEFTDESTIRTTAEEAGVPFQFMPTTPPVLIPMVMARLEGQLDNGQTVTILGGAIPVEAFVTEVVDPLLPPEEEYDPAEFNGLERDELLQQVRDIANMPTVSDIELESGERAFSAALAFQAEAISW
jgi:hypothetical protein